MRGWGLGAGQSPVAKCAHGSHDDLWRPLRATWCTIPRRVAVLQCDDHYCNGLASDVAFTAGQNNLKAAAE